MHCPYLSSPWTQVIFHTDQFCLSTWAFCVVRILHTYVTGHMPANAFIETLWALQCWNADWSYIIFSDADFEVLSSNKIAHQCQGQMLSPSGMPGVGLQPMAGTCNRSGGTSPVPPVIRALLVTVLLEWTSRRPVEKTVASSYWKSDRHTVLLRETGSSSFIPESTVEAIVFCWRLKWPSRRLTKETVLLRPDSRRDAALYKLFTYLLVVFLEKGPS